MTILWDWNGTLLDDTAQCVAAINGMLAKRGLPAITLDFHRRRFAFPARNFYREIGMDVPEEEWDALAREYHDAYLAQPSRIADGAVEALELANAAGVRQTILSALRQDYLEAAVSRFALAGYFAAICGSDNLDGGSKLERAKSFAATLGGDALALIGDSIHDKEVADAIGAKCVLYGGGSHSPDRLAGLAPVASSLPEAVELAIGR